MRPQTNKENKSNKTNKFLAKVLAVTLIATSTAAISSTFAWFTYRTHNYVSYNGTTVGGGKEFEIGLVTNVRVPEVEYLFKEIEEMDGFYIYWSEDGLTPNMVQPIIARTGTALNELHPVTTGAYRGGQPKFYRELSYLRNYEIGKADDYAKFEDYQKLSLAFRVIEENLEADPTADPVYVPNYPIYFTKAILESDTEIYKATRFHTTDGSRNYLIAPARDDGYTTVGGVLDLNGDGYYDTHMVNGKLEEYAYGEFDSDVVYNDYPNEGETPIPVEEHTTFKANHEAGSYSIKDSCAPSKVYYSSMNNFRKGKLPITTTGSDENHPYAYLDFTTYVEGWDKSVIEQEKGSKFNLELKFEIVS